MIISKDVGRTYAIFSAPIGNVFKRAAKERIRVLLNEIEVFLRIWSHYLSLSSESESSPIGWPGGGVHFIPSHYSYLKVVGTAGMSPGSYYRNLCVLKTLIKFLALIKFKGTV